jgi:hypothetical protein
VSAPAVTLYATGAALIEWPDGSRTTWNASQVRRILRRGKGGTCPKREHDADTCARCALKRAAYHCRGWGAFPAEVTPLRGANQPGQQKRWPV